MCNIVYAESNDLVSLMMILTTLYNEYVDVPKLNEKKEEKTFDYKVPPQLKWVVVILEIKSNPRELYCIIIKLHSSKASK